MRTWLGWSTEITVPESGYFFCPTCERRQPTGVHHVHRRLTVCLMPVHTRQTGAFYRCETCRRDYPAEEGHGYDYSTSPEPSTWACFKCGGVAPGHVFTCPHCGFTLNRAVETLTGKSEK
jgi:hypothetical protein